MQWISWRCGLMAIPIFFAGGFFVVSGMKLANNLFAGASFNQSLKLINHESDSYFTADGEATLTLIPDQASVNLGIQVNAASVKQAKQQADQIINNFTTKLATMNIKKEQIKTTRYNLSPNYDYSTGSSRINGYNVESELEITFSDFDALNQVIDLASQNGINHIGQIHFSASAAKLEEIKNQARSQAIEQAKRNAQSLADLTGVKLGHIVNVYEHSNNYDDGGRLYKQAMTLSSRAIEEKMATTDLHAGQQEYYHSVTIAYTLE